MKVVEYDTETCIVLWCLNPIQLLNQQNIVCFNFASVFAGDSSKWHQRK